MSEWNYVNEAGNGAVVSKTGPDYDWTKHTRCPECHSFSGPYDETHSPTCKTASIEFKAKQLMAYYEAWKRDKASHAERVKRLTDEIARLQAKNAVVRHENNKLRRRIAKAFRDIGRGLET